MNEQRVELALKYIQERLPEKTFNQEYTCDKFKIVWDGEEEEYIFKYKDFSCTWYKRIGRGMEYSRNLTDNEIDAMLIECISA